MRANTSAVVSALLLSGALSSHSIGHAADSSGGAVDSAAPADSLQEVVVTAERRREDVQAIPATIAVLQGQDLQNAGRVSVQQILEDVPNVDFGVLAPGQSPDNPSNNLAIRGIRSTQQTGGRPGPAVVGTYVDDVFQGIGGDYDLNRVEVLYGPQGTLYGRSATAGVVAFHTNDPQLGKFGTDVYAEYASYDHRNGTAVVNLPVGDTLALRVAVHEDDTHGYWWNTYGGASQTTEGRVKLLYQPVDNLRILLSASSESIQGSAGGPAQQLIAPGQIKYFSGSTAINPVAGNQYNQFMGSLSYDFGAATLTYTGSEHTYHQDGFQGVVGPPFMPIFNYGSSQPDQFNMHELRLTSDAGGPLTWLVGANFYSNLYRVTQESVVQSATQCGPCGIPDTTPGVAGGEIFSNGFVGNVKDYALFTEETYALTDRLRLTGGLRYDRNQVQQNTFYYFNVNLDQYGQSVGTCANLQAVTGTPQPCSYSSFNARNTFDNLTYKARVEYDLAPSSKLYAMVSTGYLPGDAQISPQPHPDGTVNYLELPYSQERLTAYEIGSKNRFLDNRLQLNADVFYYDYQGWQEAAQLGQAVGGAPIFAVVAVPLRVTGAEVSSTWLPTADDRVMANIGWFDDEITSWPNLPGTTTSERSYISIKRLPGVAPASGMLSYDHTFHLGNGSTLVPRGEVRWLSGENIIELTQLQAATATSTGATLLQDDYQGAYAVIYAGLSWNSPAGTYGLTGYVRNLANKEAATYLNLNQGFFSTIPLEPRTYGISVRAKF